MRLIRLRILASRLLDPVYRRRRDARLADEIRAHLDELSDAFVAKGMSRADAEHAARKAFGGVDRIRVLHREQRGLPLVDSLAQDVRLAARLFVKEMWFTATTVLTLALGIGCATAVFTIVKGMNLSELPVDEPARIMHLHTMDATSGRLGRVSFTDFGDWQRVARSFSGMAAFAGANVNVGDANQPADRFGATFISSNGFSVLRVHPVIGRDFVADDDRPGADPVAILTYAMWRDRYGLDPAIVGRQIRVNGIPATVVGVMADGFRFPMLTDIWQPLAVMPGLARDRRDAATLEAYGRLADGVTLDAARAELAAIAASLAAQFPTTNRHLTAGALPFTVRFAGRLTDPPPLLMMCAVSFVLLIACANAASLLLARAAHRAREIALRAAMGAPRGRLVRQLLVESVFLATAAGLVGLLLSFAGVRLFTSETADFNLPYWMQFGLDGRTFVFLAVVCLGVGVVFGIAPAWQLARVSPHDILNEGGRGVAGGHQRRRWMSGLLIAELALTLTLLVGAGLLLRSGAVLYDADLVVDTSNVLTARITPPAGTFAAPDAYRRFHAALQERLDANPELQAASVVSALPFGAANSRHVILDSDASSPEPPRAVPTIGVGDRYFDVLGLPLLQGRVFAAGDADPNRPAAIVNERFAAYYFPGTQAIGRRIQLPDLSTDPLPGPWLTIVGVAPTIRQNQNGPAGPAVYIPIALQPPSTAAVLVRGLPGRELAAILRNEVRALDHDVALYGLVSLDRVSQQSRWIPRAMSTALLIVAVIAFALATLGLYGVTAYGVVQRTAEIGIRTALGAQRSQVVWLFVRGLLGPLATGLGIGLAGAAALGQLLRGFLVQTSPLDPLTFAGMLIALIGATIAACFIPARRAATLDPVAALRQG